MFDENLTWSNSSSVPYSIFNFNSKSESGKI